MVDASLVAMWVLEEPLSHRGDALVEEWSRAGIQLLSPSFMLAEVSNAIYKRVRRGEFTLEEAQEALDIVLDFNIDLVEEPDLHRRAVALAHELDRPTPYDAHYLALAELRNCHMRTGVERLHNAVGARFSRLRWIGSETQPA
ncbi:MAG: type II toxin-antitoxin system VapC family toxin [Chloroflexi bacterium]|nr:type II toxin-antitoxin system VapC family toxin [Chloroflexota bacterium]